MHQTNVTKKDSELHAHKIKSCNLLSVRRCPTCRSSSSRLIIGKEQAFVDDSPRDSLWFLFRYRGEEAGHCFLWGEEAISECTEKRVNQPTCGSGLHFTLFQGRG